MNRRHFLALATTAALALKAKAAAPLRVREDVITSPDLATYAAGVGKLKASGEWQRLAEVHNVHCAHANWFFFPWHRAYLYHCERLIQMATGDASFAMPYWNWTAHPMIPAAFFDPASALYDVTRKVKPGQEIPGGCTDPLTVRFIMGDKNANRFMGGKAADQWDRQAFGGVEATPHNNVHVWISGDMGIFMSPLDPIFWLHHANIDRLWKVWEGKNPTDAAWVNHTMRYGVTMPAWKVEQTLSTEAIGYRYDREEAP
ncbi:MAG TPA: tyrosinase family protein [Chthoniobacterales bacterium]